MGEPAHWRAMTVEEYLAFEEASSTKHEYVRGEIVAMSGTTDFHNDVMANVHGFLRSKLRGGPCRAYVAEVKLHVERANTFFYPDVFVTCDPRDREDPLVKRYASIVVEVLSKSTAAYDRDEKFADYRQLDSLIDYVLVNTESQRVELFRREEHGWRFLPLGPGDTLSLASIDVDIPVSAMYEDTAVPLRAPRPAAE